MKTDYLWVVEMWNPGKHRWDCTVGVRFSRSEGKIELDEWRQDNPNDLFRLRKYIRQETTHESR